MKRLFGFTAAMILGSMVGCGAAETPVATKPAPAAPTVEASGSGSGSGAAEAAAPVVEAPKPPALNALGSNEPLNEATRKLVWETTEDDAPELLNATRKDLENRHYLTCDELHVAKFYPNLKGIKGAYIGVGSDQAYTFMGWMDAELAWLTDYDPWIKQEHRIYALFFERAETPEAFVSQWRSRNRAASRAMIAEHFATDPEKALILQVFDSASYKVDVRMSRLIAMAKNYKIPTFVSDAAMYAHVRSMVLGGRVRPRVSNLLDTDGLTGVGNASRAVNVPIRVVYMSNAEDYWPYSEQFRANMAGLNFDENSWILRTAASKPTNGDYRYNMQDAQNFQAWLKEPYVKRRGDVWPAPYVNGDDDIPMEVLDAPPVNRRAKKK